MSTRATVPPDRPGIDVLARWLARVVVDQALAEREKNIHGEDDDARGDLLSIQQREAV